MEAKAGISTVFKNKSFVSLKDFRISEQNRVKQLSNRRLYEEFKDATVRDDYYGGFTNRGNITFEILKKELELRLHEWFGDD